MFIVGDDYWGKVDWLPGLFYVKTRFLHIWWFPLVPRGSVLFYDENPAPEEPRGVRIPMRWKSVWLAWLQSWLLVSIVLFVAGGISLLVLGFQEGKMRAFIAATVSWTLFFLACFLYWWSCRWTAPSLSRALELGKILAIPQETIELQLKIAR